MNAVIRARVDECIEQEAAAVLASMGLTPSDAFRTLMTRIAAEKALPFAPRAPNEATIAAMRQPLAGGLPCFATVAALMDDLRQRD